MFLTGQLLLTAGFSVPNIYAWHEHLGISNEQAAQLYKTNPQDPQITRWQNGMQSELSAYTDLCGEGGHINPTSDHCIGSGKQLNDLCMAHAGQLLICLDPLFSENAKKWTPEIGTRYNESLELFGNP